ncbi:hypothetical protein C0995_003880 [Termitomyces sp. Mi166|nr:hypothetical protein C0995_003880 [Termitomyces sp. Mi166\
MLKEKQKHFEREFNVPEKEHVTGNGWILSFCQAYKIREYWQHGEADSVDLEAVEAEWQNVKKITDAYKEKDLFNIDESNAVEAKLMESVNELVKQKQIFEQALSLKDLLDPVKEKEDSDSAYRFEGGDAEDCCTVQQEMEEQRGEFLEMEEFDDKEETDPHGDCSIAELITLTKKLKQQSLKYADADFPLELSQQLCRFQAQLKHEQIHTGTRSRLDSFFNAA